MSVPVREADQKNQVQNKSHKKLKLESQDHLNDNISSLKFETQVHKGREQFWSLLLVAINIITNNIITMAMMEIGEDALRSPTDLANLLHCSSGGKAGTLRWWFQNLDRYQYVIGNTDKIQCVRIAI